MALVTFQSLLAVLVGLFGDTAPNQASLVRIVVLDTSGSMAGERLSQARKELLEMARQLPPAKDHPFMVVPFNTSAVDVGTFTDLPSLEHYLGQLQGNGGTSIAAGLKRALAELQKYRDIRHICVLLYTDGQDPDTAGIQKQEQQLDLLFGYRAQHGLQQTVVFCKRWQGANADLVALIKKRGHAQVIDAGELRLLPVTLRPSVRVSDVRWSKKDLNLLEIDLRATVQLEGKIPDHSAPKVRFTCGNSGARGDISAHVSSGQPTPTPLSISLPISPDILASGRTHLDFEIAQPSNVKVTSGLVLPQLPLDSLRVPVTLPAIAVRSLIKATIAPANQPTWVDPIVGRPAFPISLTLDVESIPDRPWREPVHFGITPDSGNHIIAGDDSFTLRGPDTLSVSLTLDADPCPSSSKHVPSTFKVGFTIAPKGLPKHVTFDPPQLNITQDLPSPPPVRTSLTANARSIGTPYWTDLLHGTAAFVTDIEFRVDGPLAPNTEIAVHCPSDVRRIQLTPSKITTGSQLVRLAVEADFEPAPSKKAFVFHIQPPSIQGAVRVIAPHPLQIAVVGPTPVQLALAKDGAIVPTLEATLDDADSDAAFCVVPVMAGLTQPRAATGIAAVVHPGLSLQVPANRLLPLFAPTALQTKLPSSFTGRFFYDTLVEEDITVAPNPPTPAVVGSKHRVILRVEAPFKRLLFYLAAIISTILIIFFLARMYSRLNTVKCKT